MEEREMPDVEVGGRAMPSGRPARGLLLSPLAHCLSPQPRTNRTAATRASVVLSTSAKAAQPLAPRAASKVVTPASRAATVRKSLPQSFAPARSRAFTLIELLVVMSILAILASITLVVGRSVSERSKIAQARAEMAVLAAALEQYKQQYGDYPWTPDGTDGGLDMEGGAILFNALCGNLGPQAKDKLPAKGRTFVEISRFTLDFTDDDHLPHPTETTLRTNWFNDPWGKWYYYRYRRSASDGAWKSKGFLLYSHGPDIDCDLGNPDTEDTRPVRTGLLENFPEGSEDQNRDNIYYGRD